MLMLVMDVKKRIPDDVIIINARMHAMNDHEDDDVMNISSSLQ